MREAEADIAKYVAGLVAVEEMLVRLQTILRRVAEHQGECRLDHNGFCQSHGQSAPCVYGEIKEVLG